MTNKGQGALEYLLIVGGAVVVAVFVIALMVALSPQEDFESVCRKFSPVSDAEVSQANTVAKFSDLLCSFTWKEEMFVKNCSTQLSKHKEEWLIVESDCNLEHIANSIKVFWGDEIISSRVYWRPDNSLEFCDKEDDCILIYGMGSCPDGSFPKEVECKENDAHSLYCFECKEIIDHNTLPEGVVIRSGYDCSRNKKKLMKSRINFTDTCFKAFNHEYVPSFIGMPVFLDENKGVDCVVWRDVLKEAERNYFEECGVEPYPILEFNCAYPLDCYCPDLNRALEEMKNTNCEYLVYCPLCEDWDWSGVK